MDQSFGESKNFHKPTEEELLDDYFNAVDFLTINEDFKLKMKVEKLEIEKSRIDELEAKIQKLERKHGRIR
jgi:hypothetical protein